MRLKTFLIITGFCAFISSCDKDRDKYLAANKDKILHVVTGSDYLEADGKSKLVISATLQDGSDRKTITFNTTEGVFENNNTKTFPTNAILTNGKLVGTADLKSGTEVKNDVQVKVSVNQVDTILKLQFVRAYPDSISTESSVVSIHKGFGSEVPLTTTLIRTIGIPSQHQFVNFSALRDNNTTIGEFRGMSPFGTNENGIVNSVFVLRDTSYLGVVRLVTTCQGKTATLADTLRIFVIQ